MNALEAISLSSFYGAQKVLENFSLTVAPGEFVTLMGPSGSGKSTFLHVATGLVRSAEGQVLINGSDITKMSDSKAARFRRRHIGVVFQAYNLFSTATVEENIVMGVKLDKRPIDKKRLSYLIDKLGLGGLEKKKPDEISGGERQRTAIARALFPEPDLILADEPTGNLDIKTSKDICSLLSEIGKTEKSAILLVTHDPVVAAAAKKVHFIKDGALVKSIETCNDAALVSKAYLETYS